MKKKPTYISLFILLCFCLPSKISSQNECPESWLNSGTRWQYIQTHAFTDDFEILDIAYQSEMSYEGEDYMVFSQENHSLKTLFETLLVYEGDNYYVTQGAYLGESYSGSISGDNILLRADGDSMFFRIQSVMDNSIGEEFLAFAFNKEVGFTWLSLDPALVSEFDYCYCDPVNTTVSETSMGRAEHFDYSPCADGIDASAFQISTLACKGYEGYLASYIGPLHSYLLPQGHICNGLTDQGNSVLRAFENGIASLDADLFEYPFGYCIASCTDDGDSSNGLETFNAENCECETIFETGIENKELLVSVYPSPASDYFYFQAPETFLNSPTQLLLYDLQGKEQLNLRQEINTTELRIDLPNRIDTGLYFLSAINLSSGELKSTQVLIQR